MKKFRTLIWLTIRAWYYKDNPKLRTIWLRLQRIWEDINVLAFELSKILREIKEEE